MSIDDDLATIRHIAATELLPDELRVLAALVRRVPGLLDRQRRRVDALREPHGTTLQVPPTTRDEIADQELLATWRAVAKAEGIALPPAGSVGR